MTIEPTNSPEQEIARICASRAFRQAPRPSRLLRYLAQEALAGRGAELNQYLIATDGMGLGKEFDPDKSALVRVWGARLRQMLTAYYRGPGRSNPLRVRLPERSFCPVFETRGKPVEVSHPEDSLPKLAIVEFRGVALRGPWRHFPALLAETIVGRVAAMDALSVLGPFERNPVAATNGTAVDIGQRLGADHLLDGSVHATPAGCLVNARLVRVANGTVCRAEAFELKTRGGKIPALAASAAARLARFVGEGLVAVRREVVQVSAGRPVEELSAKEAMMLVWHAYSTMSPRDISAAQKAMRSARPGSRPNP